MNEYPGSFDELIDEPYKSNGNASDGEAPRFTLIPFKSLTPSNLRRYLVKDVFPRVGLILVWWPPKCGKSFWTFDTVMHIALGWEYRGRRIHQGPVVYCAFEGAEGFKARAEAFRRQHGLENAAPPFHLTEAAMDLVKDQPALVASIRAQIGGTMPVVVVLDTLNRSLRGSESSDEGYGRLRPGRRCNPEGVPVCRDRGSPLRTRRQPATRSQCPVGRRRRSDRHHPRHVG